MSRIHFTSQIVVYRDGLPNWDTTIPLMGIITTNDGYSM